MAFRRSLAFLFLLVLLVSCARGAFTPSSPEGESEPPPGDPTDTGPAPEAAPTQADTGV